MPERHPEQPTCPFLGLTEDPDVRFYQPQTAHRCFAKMPETAIALEHQQSFCFSKSHTNCPRFNGTSDNTQQAVAPASGAYAVEPEPTKALTPGRLVLWGIALILLGTTGVYYLPPLFQQLSDDPATGTSSAVVEALSTLTPTPTPLPAETITPSPAAIGSGEITPAATRLEITTPTPEPQGELITLSPEAADIGWVVNGEDRGNHFGDSFLYAGVFEGQIYQSAFQLDLSSIPRGAPIHQAFIRLTGLQDDRLGQGGTWTLRLLAPEIDPDWRRRNFQEIFNAPSLHTLNPILGEQDLQVAGENIFELSLAQIRLIEQRVIDDEEPKISFRLDGPLVGADNLFAWDTGYGPKSEGNKVELVLDVGEPPATPPPFDFVIVTSTPTPENVVTAAAVVMQITAEAEEFGTATPVPPNVVTATPFPDYLVIVPTSVPENYATVEAIEAIATASVLTTGTPTPFPTNAVTATFTPSPTSTPTPLPPPTYVVVTSTPTAVSVFAAATISAEVTALALRNGTATPVPANWATPIIVTSTPGPANQATAEHLELLATAQALTTGTPTPVANNVQTATPTPAFVLIAPIIIPTATPIVAAPDSMPEILIGKIIFLSDREVAEEDIGKTTSDPPQAYVYDPETGDLGRLNAYWPYQMAETRDSWSAENRFRVFTKDFTRYKDIYNSFGVQTGIERIDLPAVYWFDSLYNVENLLTNFGTGLAYQGVWSPTAEQIAFVSNESGDDEIWIVNRNGSELRELTKNNVESNASEIGKDTFIPEVNLHPSFSPDGQQIIFQSTRTGKSQLWIMNTDGSDQRLLMDWNPYNDWAPVWVKYEDPAPY